MLQELFKTKKGGSQGSELLERLLAEKGKQSGFISIPSLEQLAEPPGQGYQGCDSRAGRSSQAKVWAGDAEINPALQLNTWR